MGQETHRLPQKTNPAPPLTHGIRASSKAQAVRPDGPFDTRDDDVFVPAIRAATLDADRVDRDSSAVIPMEEVETMIRAADAGLADISASNPNVWFELGFAMAAGKSVVLVCLQDPNRRCPFDIQHRKIIT